MVGLPKLMTQIRCLDCKLSQMMKHMALTVVAKKFFSIGYRCTTIAEVTVTFASGKRSNPAAQKTDSNSIPWQDPG